jgi:hypothetical protein
MKWNGSTWTDYTSAIATAISTFTPDKAVGGCEMGGSIYVFSANYGNKMIALTSSANNGVTWTNEFILSTGSAFVGCRPYNGKIFYLISIPFAAELRAYDPVLDSDVSVATFEDAEFTAVGLGSHFMREFQGKLVVTIPGHTASNGKVYEYDGSNLAIIWEIDETKTGISSVYYGDLFEGCVESKGRLHWGNLVYDGVGFFPSKRAYGNSVVLYPVFNNKNNSITYTDWSDYLRLSLWQDSSAYICSYANNYMILNEMSPVSSLDKLLDSVTIIYDKMTATTETIKVDYSIDNRVTWHSVGSKGYVSGNTDTKTTWMIPGNIVFSKIWFKIFLTGSSSTPKLHDFIMAYKPVPDYKNSWVMRLNFSQGVKLLNKQDEARTPKELLTGLWNESSLKSKITFEDIDYSECTLVSAMTATATSALVNSVNRLPMRGRIRAMSGSVAEEMTYTSAETNKIKGITRAARGSTSRAYASGQILKNDYDVYIQDMRSTIDFIDEKKFETIAQVTLIEA